MAAYKSAFSLRILRLALGAFFVILGISGIFKELGESVFALSSSYITLEVIFGVAEIICGLLLFLGFFLFSDSRPVYWGGFIVLIFWISRIVLSRFIWGLNFINNGNISVPLLFQWLLIFCAELIIAASLLIVLRRYD